MKSWHISEIEAADLGWLGRVEGLSLAVSQVEHRSPQNWAALSPNPISRENRPRVCF